MGALTPTLFKGQLYTFMYMDVDTGICWFGYHRRKGLFQKPDRPWPALGFAENARGEDPPSLRESMPSHLNGDNGTLEALINVYYYFSLVSLHVAVKQMGIVRQEAFIVDSHISFPLLGHICW